MNDTTAPREAPSLRSDMAVGMTPQEQSGNGIPNNAAYITERILFEDKQSPKNLLGRNECIKPASKKPRSKYGDIPKINVPN